MKKKNLMLCSLFFTCLLILWFTGSWLTQKEKIILFDSVVDAAITSNGDYWVTDMGGKRVIHTDSNLKVKKIFKPKEIVKQLVVNDRDEVFLRTVTIKNQNNSIAEETIFRIGENQDKMESVYQKVYERLRLRGEIFDISGKTESLILGIKEENGFGFYQLSEDGALKELFYKSLKEADVWIASAVILEEENMVYYCLQNGMIRTYNMITGEETDIYKGFELTNREGVPRKLTSDKNNNVYFTDLGLRDVGYIDNNHISYLMGNYDLPQEEFLEQESLIGINAERELLVCSSYALYLQEEGEFVPYYEVELDTRQVIYSWLSKISVLFIGLIIFYYILMIARHVIKGNQISSKIMFAICVVSGIITMLFLFMVIPDYKEQMTKELEYRTQNVAYLTAGNIPAQALLNLDSVGDFRNDDYNKVKEVIDKIFLDEQGVHDFYCTIYTIRDNVITTNYSSEESSGSIYPYDWAYEGSDEQEIIETGVGKVYTGYLNSDGNYTFSLYPIEKEDLGVIGLVEVGVNTQPYEEHIDDLISDLLITMAVAVVVVIFLVLEILVCIEGGRKMLQKKSIHLPNELLRTLVFLIFLVTNIATSFLPIYALNLAEKLGGVIAGEIWASLVISAEVFSGAILSIKGNIVLLKLGHRKSAILGSMVMLLGMFLRVIPGITFLMAGQLFIGAGWGILLLIVNTRISLNEEEKDEGFAGYSAAAFNGINCGVVLGGFAMKFMNYSTIILATAILSLLVLLHVWKLMKDEEMMPVSKQEEGISVLSYLKKRRIWSFLLLLVFPVIACGYYLNYLYPILASETGMEESYIGYSYLINGMVVLSMGNLLTRKLTTWLGRKGALVLSVLLYGMAFVFVSVFHGIPVLLVSLLLLGLADSFGLPIQSSYLMDLEETKEFGYERAAGIYSLVENLAQSAGPVMFGYILLFGLSAGMKILAAGASIFALLFLILSLSSKENKKRKNR